MKLLAAILALALALPLCAKKAPVPWSSGLLIDYQQDDGLRKGPLDDKWGDKKAFTFTLRFGDGTIWVLRKITGSVFDTTPFVVVNKFVSIRPFKYDPQRTFEIGDENARVHRVKLIKIIAPPKQ